MDFSDLGLSPYEQQAYETLIKHGPMTANNLSRESGVSYGKIYEVMGRLEHKGLVKVMPDRTKRFAPSDPQHLIDMIEKKEKRLTQARSKLKELKKVYKYTKEEPVILARGGNAFLKLLSDLKNAKTFSYSIKWGAMYNPKTPRQRKEAYGRGVKFKTLTRVAPDIKTNLQKWLKLDNNIKGIENDGVAINISDEEVMILLINQNTSMIIRDVAFVKVMKEMYEALYVTKSLLTDEIVNSLPDDIQTKQVK